MNEVIEAQGIQERTGNTDAALAQSGGLTYEQFNHYAEEVRNQPLWRTEADRCADYYDGNQLDQARLAELDARGMAPLIVNLVQPAINVVLGMEAKTRLDWRVAADGDQFQDVAEAMSQRLFEVERESRADRACSDAYGGQIKSGLGWVEASRNSDPFRYPYRVSSVHRREMFWDWASREPDLDDARYLIRKRFFDVDYVAAFMPQHRELLHAATFGWTSEWLQRATENTGLAQAFEIERACTLEDWEWRDAYRRRIALLEVWYRVFVRGYVIRLPDERVVELDMRNPMHQVALARGVVKPQPAVYSKMRMSLWAGPHKLLDQDQGQKRPPYIPFWGYREDLTGVPYGLVRSMVSPQDEHNARRQKLLWLLSARRMTYDSDAFDTKINSVDQVLAELNRPDAAVALNAGRKNRDGFAVDSNIGLAQQQFEIMMESKQALQDASGIFQQMLGNQGNASSGIAINSLVEQSSTVLAEINDNYRYSRRLVGEQCMDMLREDMSGRQIEVVVGEMGSKRKTIILNKPTKDPNTGMVALENDVGRSKVKVALQDVPATPAYRQQQFTMLSEVMKGLPPQLQMLLAPWYIDASDLPARKDMMQLLKKQLGIEEEVDFNSLNPEQKQQYIEKLREIQEGQDQQKRAAIAAVREQEAKASKTEADAVKSAAQAQQIQQDTSRTADKHELDMATGAVNLDQKRIEAIAAALPQV